MASIEMGTAGGPPSKSPSVVAGQVGDVQQTSEAGVVVQRNARFERSVCCAYVLHIISAGILGHMYAGAWDVALHRALNFFFWLYNAPPLMFTSLVLFIVDFFYLADTVKRHNKNPLDNTKTKCQACLMMLPPVGCFGIHHAYFRNWTHLFLYSATGSGFGIAYVADCCRLDKYTEEANTQLHGATQIEILFRDTVRRYVMPTYLCLYRKYWLPQLPPSPFDDEAQPLVQGSSDDLGATTAPPMQPSNTVGATAGQAPLSSATQDRALDQEKIITRDMLVLSLCPCAHWSGLSACCAGAPRQGIVHALTCSGFGVLFLIDLFSLPCRHRQLNAHKHMRRRALNVGIPAPREEIPCANAYGTWCSTGLCGGHQLILGNFWLFLGTLMSFGGFGMLWLCDLFFLKRYLATYRQQRAHEEALVGTVERAKRWGSASMQLQEGEGETTTTRSITVGSASAGAAVDAFNELDASPAVSTFTAWVCWLPFGGLFGLHHLYLGRYAHFAVALCTFNLVFIGWIADAFLMEWYIDDAKYKFDKKVLAQAARVHTTQPGLEGGLPLAGTGSSTTPPGAGQMYDTGALVSSPAAGDAGEATTVLPPPVPGLYASAAEAASAPAYSYATAVPGYETAAYPPAGPTAKQPAPGPNDEPTSAV